MTITYQRASYLLDLQLGSPEKSRTLSKIVRWLVGIQGCDDNNAVKKHTKQNYPFEISSTSHQISFHPAHEVLKSVTQVISIGEKGISLVTGKKRTVKKAHMKKSAQEKKHICI